MHNPSNLKANGLQEQKTALGSAPVSEEKKSEAAMGTGSPNLES